MADEHWVIEFPLCFREFLECPSELALGYDVRCPSLLFIPAVPVRSPGMSAFIAVECRTDEDSLALVFASRLFDLLYDARQEVGAVFCRERFPWLRDRWCRVPWGHLILLFYCGGL